MDQFVVRGISAADAADNLHRELLMHDEQRFQMSLDRQAAIIEKRLPRTTNLGPSPRLNLAASPSTPPALARTGKAYENWARSREVGQAGAKAEVTGQARVATRLATMDRNICLWNPARGTLIKTYPGHGYEVRDVCVSADNSKFASCGGDKQVFLWDVGTGRFVRKLRGHDSTVNSIKWAAQDDVLVTGGYDQSVKLWDCKSRSTEAMQVMKAFKDSVTCVVVRDHEIVASSVDGSIRRFDIRMCRVYTDDVHHAVTSVAVSHDGLCLLAACLDSTLRLLDKTSGELLASYRGHVHQAVKMDCCLMPSDAQVVGSSKTGALPVLSEWRAMRQAGLRRSQYRHRGVQAALWADDLAYLRGYVLGPGRRDRGAPPASTQRRGLFYGGASLRHADANIFFRWGHRHVDRCYMTTLCEQYQQDGGQEASGKEATLPEARVLSSLRHPHIVPYREFFRHPDGELCLVMAYCEGGDLYQYIKHLRRSGQSMDEGLAWEWLVQLLLALSYCHSKKVLHRDVKTQNVMLSKGKVLLGDFGLAKQLQRTLEMARTPIGTPFYMAPEIYEEQPYSFKSDVWALGCVAYEMLAGKPAFAAENLSRVVL
ncbi:hypothetical protein QJQ45_015488, partial [Haematococcus lacustris]